MKIEKTYHGKRAFSQFELGEDSYLEVVTMKRSNGAVLTTLTNWRRISPTMSQMLISFNDKAINHGAVSRLTDKKFTELHQDALKQIGRI